VSTGPSNIDWRRLVPLPHFVGHKLMAASYLPSILVPIVGLVFPAVTMALLFIYIEREDAAGI